MSYKKEAAASRAGRVAGYADGGTVRRRTGNPDLDVGIAAAAGARAGGGEPLLTHNRRMEHVKSPSQEVDDVLARQKASDDASRMGRKRGGRV